MLQVSTRAVLITLMIAASVFLGGCGTPSQPASGTGGSSRPRAASVASATAAAPAAAPGEAVAAGSSLGSDLAAVDPAVLPAGSLFRNPANGRDEVITGDTERTALLIGDSQSEPKASWPRRALADLGYDVFFCGKGGTGYVASNGATGNYVDALQRGDWHLPYGFPPLVVIQGGGNDARQGASDEQIVANAESLITTLKQRYPGAKLVMVGTLAKGTGRRTEVDALLGSVAAAHSIPFVSVGDWLTRYGLEEHLADSVHMNDDGHRALGMLLGDRLEALGLDLD
ncbi:SGNH/GDSL hydrolase family protein [Arthrobacter sp. ISL-28]|uniref:SGNH/GDSL hydrolase family protein n=1 Tax=Arthrobacter sp. ISL-28 TaxID=2819108 RepID=UPI001BE56AEB|nr:SGNH/GDSL hydrolase family protein [Arthrobacter sp. ISL-28]MBT2522908.1 SGNH/GDSL hydrolase family protein [Arthrobacter sp. ISL-28]